MLLLFVLQICACAFGLHISMTPYSADDMHLTRHAMLAANEIEIESPIMPSASTPLPSALHGHNLVLLGDSNDRMFINFLCEQSGAEVQLVKTMTWNHSLLEFPCNQSCNMSSKHPSAGRFCHIPTYNSSVMFFFHFGALTTAPQPWWHSHMLNTTWYSSHLPKVNTTKISSFSSADFVGFWQSAVARHLPQRPLTVIAQSSLWDTLLAKMYLLETHQVKQADLNAWGWNRSSQSADSELAAWDWMEHVSLFLKAVQTGFGLPNIYWRTNPNCPTDDNFVNSVSEAQATRVRKAVRAGKGIWSDVILVDWRNHYRASSMDECNRWHYKKEGLEAYLELLWKIF
jgi:hypothetical protein